MKRLPGLWPAAEGRRRIDETTTEDVPPASATTKLLLFAGTFVPALLATLVLRAYRRRRRNA